jgi:hypothetical protein
MCLPAQQLSATPPESGNTPDHSGRRLLPLVSHAKRAGQHSFSADPAP